MCIRKAYNVQVWSLIKQTSIFHLITEAYFSIDTRVDQCLGREKTILF